MNKKKISGFLLFIMVLTILVSTGNVLAGDVITLQEVLKSGFKNNSEIKQSSFDVRVAEKSYQVAQKSLYPEVGLNWSYTRLEEGPTTYGIQLEPDIYNTSITLQQPIYMGGKLRLGIDQAEQGINLAQVQAEQQESQVILNIIESYYNVLMAGERVKIEEESLELVREHKRSVQASLDMGMSLKTDLLQVEIEEANTQQSLNTARDVYRLAKKQLSIMIGLDIADKEVVSPELNPDIDLDYDSLYQTALDNRPDLEMLNINKEITEINLTIEEKNIMPDIAIAGKYGWEENGEFKLEDGDWSVTLSASVDIFDSGRSKTNQEKIKEELGKIEETKSNLEKMVSLDLEQQITSIEQSTNNINIQQMNLTRANENVRLETRRYEAGIGTNLNVMNAHTMLKQARVALLQARNQYSLSLFTLLQKTGKLTEYIGGVINNE